MIIGNITIIMPHDENNINNTIDNLKIYRFSGIDNSS